MQQYPTQRYPNAEIQPEHYGGLSYDHAAHKSYPVTLSHLYQDEDDRRTSVTNTKGRPKPNYRPVTLRWWYILSLILVFVGLCGVVIYSSVKLRGVQKSGHVEQRSMTHDEAWALYRRGLEERQDAINRRVLRVRQDPVPTEEVPGTGDSQPTDVTDPPPADATDPAPADSAPADSAPTDPVENAPTNPPDSQPTNPPETGDTQNSEPVPEPAPESDPNNPPETQPSEPPATEPSQPPATEPSNPPETQPSDSPDSASSDPVDPESTQPPVSQSQSQSQSQTTSSARIPESNTSAPPKAKTTDAPKSKETESADPKTTTTDGGDDETLDTNDTGRKAKLPDGQFITDGWVEVNVTQTLTSPGDVETFTTTFVTTTTGVSTITETEEVPGKSTTLGYADETDGGAGPTDTGSKELSSTSGEGQVPVVTYIPPHETTVERTVPFTSSFTTTAVRSTTEPGDRYLKIGKTTLFSTFTIDRQGEIVIAPRTSTFTSQIPGHMTTSFEQPPPTTQVNFGVDGLPTTVTITPPPIAHVTSVPPTQVLVTATSTPSGTPNRIVVKGVVYEITTDNYFIGKFLPPLVAVFLALAIRAIDQTAKLYQPFAALSHPLGASGRDSLTLHFDGWKGFWRPFGMISKGHPVPFFSTMAVWLSATLTPVATEAIGLKLQGRCKNQSILGCAQVLGVTETAAYVLVGLLAAIAIFLLLVLISVSRRWKTGVFADPWCVAGAAALSRNPDIRSIGAMDFGAVKAAITEKRFSLGWYRNQHGREEYGLVLCDEMGRSLRGAQREEASAMMMESTNGDGMVYQNGEYMRTIRKPPATFVALTFWWRLLFLIYMLALVGFIIYYHLDIKVPGSLKDLIASERGGVRFVSSALGMIVILCWDCVFYSIAIVAPYRRMANKPQPGRRSVLAKRPTFAVTGIYAGIRERDPLLAVTASMAVLSDFLPMLFANVPYDLTQTELVHLVCARLSAGFLLLMVVVLITSMFVRWPELPVDPRSVAGEIWYVAEARWSERLEGVSTMNDKERKNYFHDMGGKWYYGSIGTRLGDRMGVEMHDAYGLMEYTGLAGRMDGGMGY